MRWPTDAVANREDRTMSRFLVAYASKMGGTRGIAEVVGTELSAAGHEVAVADAGDVRDLTSFDSVVLGSAIYTGRWRSEAVRLLKRHAAALAERRVWLFQSGPCGDGQSREPVQPPANVIRLASRIGARPPVTFGGRLEPETATGWLARRMAAGPLGGDYRDWDEIRAWARAIAGERSARNSDTAELRHSGTQTQRN